MHGQTTLKFAKMFKRMKFWVSEVVGWNECWNNCLSTACKNYRNKYI